MYRLIATDLDGTLLRSDKTVSDETIKELNRLNGQGVFFVPCTGRTHRELPEAVRNLPFVDFAITCNGGGIYDYRQQKYIYSFAIDNQKAREIIRAAIEMPVYRSMVVEGLRIVQADEKGNIPDFVYKNAAKGILEHAVACPDLLQYLEETGKDAQKILVYPMRAEDRKEIMEKFGELFPELAITTSGPLFVELNARGIDKGKALRLLCGHLNVDIEESIAFGDAENDLALLDAAGLAVVTANGTEETKKHADMICDSCDNDGVRKALQQLFK